MKHEYTQLLIKIEELEVLATHITVDITGMPKGGNTQTDDTWAALADYKSRCIDKVTEYINECKKLDEEIDSLRFRKSMSFQIRAVMKCRYLDGLTVAQIAEKLHYSDRSIRRFLRYGREHYWKKYGEESVESETEDWE